MKNTSLLFLLFICVLNTYAQTPLEDESVIRSEIYAAFEKNKLECNDQVIAITDTNGKTEFWSICELDNRNRILRIESHTENTYYQEVYFEKNRALVYAKETENYIPNNHFTQMAWHCEFYTRNGKLIALMSHGHGKTEEETWNPEIIFDMYRKRLDELEKIKK